MSVVTYEAFIEHGTIRLPAHVNLPDHTKVYIVVPERVVEPIKRIVSPRLGHAEQLQDFVMEMHEDDDHAARVIWC